MVMRGAGVRCSCRSVGVHMIISPGLLIDARYGTCLVSFELSSKYSRTLFIIF